MLVLVVVIGVPRIHFAREARQHLATMYTPAWEALFLREGIDDAYPMPAASEVVDLLTPLKDVSGIAVHTQPETTVTEGMGCAPLFSRLNHNPFSCR